MSKNTETFDVIAQIEQGVAVNKVKLTNKDLIDIGDKFLGSMAKYPRHHLVFFSEDTYNLLKLKGLLKKP